MEEMLMYAIYFGAGFLFGDLFRFHLKKGRKQNGKMGRNAGSSLREGKFFMRDLIMCFISSAIGIMLTLFCLYATGHLSI